MIAYAMSAHEKCYLFSWFSILDNVILSFMKAISDEIISQANTHPIGMS